MKILMMFVGISELFVGFVFILNFPFCFGTQTSILVIIAIVLCSRVYFLHLATIVLVVKHMQLMIEWQFTLLSLSITLCGEPKDDFWN